MKRLYKDVLKAQTYYPDPKNPDYKVDVTPEMLDHWSRTFQDMKDANIGIPLTFEHPPKDKGGDPAEWKQGDPRFRAGWVEDIYRDGDTLIAAVDVPDDCAEDLLETGCYVSPKFGGTWTDSERRKWSNPIHHIALTTKPVALSQSRDWLPTLAFSRDGSSVFDNEIMFSTSGGLFHEWSQSEESTVADTKLSPSEALDRLFENPEFVELARERLIEEHEFSDPTMGGQLPGLPPGMPNQEQPEPDGDECGNGVGLCIKFVSTLMQACSEFLQNMAGAAGVGDNDADDYALPGQAPEGGAGAPVTATMPAVTAMSREEIMANPVFKAMEVKLTSTERRDLSDQVNELFDTGRCTGPIRDKLLASVEKYEFSRQNEPEFMLLKSQIELLKELPEHGAVPTGKTSEFSRPGVSQVDTDEDITEDRANEIVASFFRLNDENN